MLKRIGAYVMIPAGQNAGKIGQVIDDHTGFVETEPLVVRFADGSITTYDVHQVELVSLEQINHWYQITTSSALLHHLDGNQADFYMGDN